MNAPAPAPATPVRKPKSARRRSRELALQGLYQWLLSAEDPGALAAHLREQEGVERRDRRTDVAQELHAQLGQEGRRAERLGKDQVGQRIGAGAGRAGGAAAGRRPPGRG